MQEREMEGRLLAWQEHEERQARWESLPLRARREAVQRLARMMLRASEREGSDAQGATDPGAAS